MANGITDVLFSPYLGTTPASTHRPTGVVWLNSSFQLPKKIWEFIIDHEEGHIVGDNRSEIVADEHASRKFFSKYPNEPFTTVEALEKVLPMNTPEQHLRVELQRKRAARFDCVNNGKCNDVSYKSDVSNFSKSDNWCAAPCMRAKNEKYIADLNYKQALQEGADALTLARLQLASQLATLEALKYSADADVTAQKEAAKQEQSKGLGTGQIAAIGLVALAALIIGYVTLSAE